MASRSQRNKRDPEAILTSRAMRFVTRLCQVGEATAKLQAPADQGQLRDSIQHEVRADAARITGTVSTNVEHAIPIEYGTEPHYPPIEPLKRWAARVIGDESVAYAIQKKIGRVGTKAQPFMVPSFEHVMQVKDAVARKEMKL